MMNFKEEKNRLKELMLVLGVFVLFSIVVFWSFIYIEQNYRVNTCGCKIPLTLVIIIIIAISIFSGSIITFLFLIKTESRNKVIKRDTIVTLKFLNGEERRIIEEIIKSNGEIVQSEIVKRTRLSKVKVARSLARLESKGVIVREKFGMTKKVRLIKELRDLFSCEACKV